MNKIIFALIFSLSSFHALSAQDAITITNFESSKCGKENLGSDIKKRIISLDSYNDSLVVVLASSVNCCAKIEPDVQVKKSGALNFIFKDNIDKCQCICAKELKYTLATTESEFDSYELNGYKIDFSEEKTITKRIEREFYSNGEKKWVKFYEDDELKRIIFYDESGNYVKTQYYKNGVLESEQTK